MHQSTLLRFLAAVGSWLVVTAGGKADPNVSLTASADPAYTERKYGEGKPRAESYVFMQGRYFSGHTVDRSIERMPFRRIAEYLAVQLAKQQYFPTPVIGEAELLIVVHWGTTLRHVGTQEMTGRTSAVTDSTHSVDTMIRDHLLASPGLGSLVGDNRLAELNFDRLQQVSDQVGAEMHRADNVTLLGYADELHRLHRDPWISTTERSLRYDLSSERYFIILKAYDLKAGTTGSRRPIWTMHLNISSPGNNFLTALDRLSTATVSYLGRNTGGVRNVRPGVPAGRVDMAPLVILKEEVSGPAQGAR